MGKGNEKGENLSQEEWAKRFDLPQQDRGRGSLTILCKTYNLNKAPNFYNKVLAQPHYYNPQFRGDSSANQGFTMETPTWNLIEEDYDTPPNEQKDTYKPPFLNINNVTQSTQFGGQSVDQYSAPDSFNPSQDQGTPTNTEDQTGQNPEYFNHLVLNPQEHFSEDFPVAESEEQPVQPLTNAQEQAQLKELLRNKDIEALDIVLQLINTTTKGIKEQRTQDNAEEADISENANELYSQSKDLYNRSKNLFILYAVAGELSVKSNAKQEMKQKAAEQLKNIQTHPLYSKEINNEPERRDACERAGRFIGETASRVIGSGLGFGAAVAVASLMIPPAMVLYGPMIVAGPVVVAGAGGAAAFMANKLGYKIADITLSNTTALAGRLLDWSKNSLRDWWNKDKEQVKALTTLKNQLLRDIETAQLGFIEARNKNDQAKVEKEPDAEKIKKLQTQMTQHLENLYINASVLKDLETSIVGQRQAEQKQKEALEEWKKNSSFMERAAKKMGATESWKSIRETGPGNICEKLGVITGKIVGLAVAAGLGAAAAIAITSSIGAAATILYGPMAVVGITAAAGITAGAVGYKIANPVATWSFKKVGYVADLAKNATYDVAKSMAVGTKNIVMGKGKHSDKEQAKKGSKIGQKKSK